MKKILLLLFLSFFINLHVQAEDIKDFQIGGISLNDSLLNTFSEKKYDPLRPSRAAFYSAVFPGLGQIYNKRYWKLPLVYGGIGASIYFYDLNNIKFRQYR